MSRYTIIEDASPYFVRFTFDGIEEIIQFVKTRYPVTSENHKNYFHRTFGEKDSNEILRMLPMFDKFYWNGSRVATFATHPGRCSSIHKDGDNVQVSFNLPICILDDKCVTRWYADDSFDDLKLEGMPYTRTVLHNRTGYDHIPNLKEMVARPREMVLFNTNIYHSWENKSRNIREILTLRLADEGMLSFDQTKELLFSDE